MTTGAGWIYASRWLDRILGFLSLAVLARVLIEEDFGLVAIAASVATIVEGLLEFDVKNALIQSRQQDRELYDTAWSMGVLRGLIAAAAMAGAACFVDDPAMANALWVLAATPLLDGLSNPRFVRFERELDYSRLAAQTLFAGVAAFAVTVVVGLLYRSHWALVLGILTGSAARASASYALAPYRPRATLAHWRTILRFSGWMTLANLVATAAMRTDRVVVGALLGRADAGSYFMTQRIGVLPTAELISPLQRILFASFSQIAQDAVRLRRAAYESINVLGSLSLPAAVGFALIAAEFVPLALGERWRHITPLLVVLVPFMGVRACLSVARACVMALGRTELMFRVSLIYALVHLPVFVIATASFGLSGAIWGIVGAGVLYVALNAWLLQTTVAIRSADILRALARPALACMAMAAAVAGLAACLPPPQPSVISLAAHISGKAALGAVVYAATLYGLWNAAGAPAGFEARVIATWRARRARG